MSKMKNGVFLLLIIGLVSLAIMSTSFLSNGFSSEESIESTKIVSTVNSENLELTEITTTTTTLPQTGGANILLSGILALISGLGLVKLNKKY